MALIAMLTRVRETNEAVTHVLGREHEIVRAATWSRLVWSLHERPVTVAVLDGAALARIHPERAIVELRRRYPSLGIVVLARDVTDAGTWFRLGRAGLSDLVILPLDGMAPALPRAIRNALDGSTASVVERVVSPSLPRRERNAVRWTLEGVQRGWDTDEVCARAGLTRPHMSVCLRAHGLPSVGRLLTWVRMLHAGRWLSDPGRTGESVSRQLGYANGATFRRALRNYVGATPSEVAALGGLLPVLECFVQACDLEVRPRALSSVA
ncbi:MAG: helix-turn-helix domain-containing protein [Gemmatimonadota bacterium]|nr:helix-turn-helix domain-containing protein [Gemmatimonadota bacterium]